MISVMQCRFCHFQIHPCFCFVGWVHSVLYCPNKAQVVYHIIVLYEQMLFCQSRLSHFASGGVVTCLHSTVYLDPIHYLNVVYVNTSVLRFVNTSKFECLPVFISCLLGQHNMDRNGLAGLDCQCCCVLRQ